jgi:hypothetical protein
MRQYAMGACEQKAATDLRALAFCSYSAPSTIFFGYGSRVLCVRVRVGRALHTLLVPNVEHYMWSTTIGTASSKWGALLAGDPLDSVRSLQAYGTSIFA